MLRRKSLKMQESFYGPESLNKESSGIEGLLKLTGLSVFLEEVENLFQESNPLLLQASELFQKYLREIADFKIEALNTIASIYLLDKFKVGGDGIGRNPDGTVNKAITKNIAETQESLRSDVNTNSRELAPSARRLSSFIATLQRKIIELLILSQQTELNEIVEEEGAENIVTSHALSESQGTNKVVEISVAKIMKQQKERVEARKNRKTGIFENLNNLFSLAREALAPTQRGTYEVTNMVMAV